MTRVLRYIVDLLPKTLQITLRRTYFYRQISQGTFVSSEEEYFTLGQWIQDRDTVIDIGANVGRYTLRMAEIVGPRGRVIAFEPVQMAFGLLSYFVSRQSYGNTVLLNLAASNQTNFCRMSVPSQNKSVLFDTHTASRILPDNSNEGSILCLPVDSLNLPNRVSFVKIDVEGHELQVLEGMKRLIERDLPAILVEDNDDGPKDFLQDRGYTSYKLSSSRNRIFYPPKCLNEEES